MVKFNKAEKYRQNFLYDNYIKIYAYRGIHQKFGITVDEYLNRPRYEIEELNRIAEEMDKKKVESNDDAMQELEKEHKKLNKPT